MRKTNTMENYNPITVDISGLQAMLSLGRGTADMIGEKAGAVVKIGKRKLYKVSKVNEYLEHLTEEV